MLEAAESAGVTHLVGHEFRWAPERATTMRAIADGVIGEPRLVTLVSYVPLAADPETKVPPWWFDPSAGGGWLGASGSHIVDMVRVWLGEFASLSARLSITSQRSDVAEDTFTLAGRSWGSRLLLGSAAYPSRSVMLDALRAHLSVSPDHVVYVGDGSSDVHVMLHVNRLLGYTIAVSENRFLAPIARRSILSDDALSVLVPILEDIAGWSDPLRIRGLFERHGLAIQEWEKVRTDFLTIRPTQAPAAAPGS